MVTKQAVAFFKEHAGYSYDPKTETPEQGRAACARDLADAEREANERGWSVEWSDDWEVDHKKEFDCYEDGGPTTCEHARLIDEDGNTLAALGCIDDADANYRRVINAELASEALADEHKAERDKEASLPFSR